MNCFLLTLECTTRILGVSGTFRGEKCIPLDSIEGPDRNQVIEDMVSFVQSFLKTKTNATITFGYRCDRKYVDIGRFYTSFGIQQTKNGEIWTTLVTAVRWNDVDESGNRTNRILEKLDPSKKVIREMLDFCLQKLETIY